VSPSLSLYSGPYSVIWRKEKSSLLYAGTFKITVDPRFSLDGTNLLFENLTQADEGEYICEVSTTPQIGISYHVKVDPKASVTPTFTSSASRSLASLTMISLVLVLLL